MPSAEITMARSSARAGGKIILLGEHSVVYGHEGLAGAIDRGVHCTATLAQTSSLSVPAWGIHVAPGDPSAPGLAFQALLDATASTPVQLVVKADLAPGAGLGSSAALCLAIARCLAPKASEKEHRDIAAAGEQQFHNHPSGIDVALSQYGGIARYNLRSGLRPLSVPPLTLVVGLSGETRSTAAQVRKVAHRMDVDRQKTSDALEAMAACASRGIVALQDGAFDLLGSCMNMCHGALQEVGVSTTKLDAMVDAAHNAGALGAKLTGAGGGGAMIALAPTAQSSVMESLQSLACEVFLATLGGVL